MEHEYILVKPLPNLPMGSSFYKSAIGNTYFHGIAISSDIPEEDQVGIVQFEAKDVENNPEWFKPKRR